MGAGPTYLSTQQRIRSIVSATIDVPLGRAWKVAADFYNLEEWVPKVHKCYRIMPGIRYVELLPDTNGKVFWVKEKMVNISNARHSVSYVILSGNFGLNQYKATLQLLATNDRKKTLVNWSFEMDANSPTPKQRQEDVLRRGIQSLAKAAKERKYA